MPIHVVRQGEHLAGIAHRRGATPAEIWDMAENAELRERRGDGAVLMPGDALHVPAAPEPRTASLRIGATTSFRADIPRTKVTLRLVAKGEPLANEPFRANADGVITSGTSNGEGQIEFQARVTTRRARLQLSRRNDTLVLDVGGLDPVGEVSGAQMRLYHLGHYRGPLDGLMTDATREGLRAFQRSRRLPESGGLDEATVTALREEYGV